MAEWNLLQGDSMTHLWKMYESGVDYQHKIGLRHTIPQNIDFYEGRQWPKPTENTRNLPRPVINIVKMICRSKKSSILSIPTRILYKSYPGSADTDKLNDFSSFIQKELNQEGLDRLAIEDGIKKGSYFYHYYWDKDARGLTGVREGGVRCEIIDPLNIFFSNPCELDEQKQNWILISTEIEASVLYDLDPSGERARMAEVDATLREGGKRTVTVLTRYFKKNGEIFCERGTKSVIITPPFPITPDVSAVKNEIQPKGDEENGVSTRENECYRQTTAEGMPKATLFPIVAGFYEKREGSIYGISEVEGIIPNQKAINFNIAMSLLNAQQCAWGKYIALPNALNGQKISNSPGQVLIDYSGTGNGIKRMSEEGLSSSPAELVELITQLTRTSTGAADIISSEALSSNLSGVAIAQLQAQAEVPVEELRATFWEAKKKQGRVLAQFIRLYYYDKSFIRCVHNENGDICEICDRFFSDEYKNRILDVTVEPIRGTKLSIASDINLLDTCLKEGKISLETYIRSYPEGVISNKYAILRQLETEKAKNKEGVKKE